MEHKEATRNIEDRLGRRARDLRISVIDNCNLRCTYCMPKEQFGERYQFLPETELLTFDEIETIARQFARLGVVKLRLTGGEPLLRRDMPVLVEKLARIPGIEELALTTNGLLLAKHAAALRAAGLDRVTVSLDSLDGEVLSRMSGRPVKPELIREGIAAAREAGLSNIKINAVVQRGVNDHTALDLVRYFRGEGITVRFIEFMDVGTRNQWRLSEVVPSRELRDEIHARFPLVPLRSNYRGEVAERYAFADGSGEVGFISSVTAPFCGDCTRARLSADGQVYTCLFATRGTDFRSPLRAGETDDQLFQRLANLWRARGDRYSELRASLPGTARTAERVEMYQIGG